MSTVAPRTTTGTNVFARLGIAPIINASGTVTVLGGSVMAPEILEAMRVASRTYVDLPEAMRRAGEYLAERIGVPGAFISSGAAGGIASSVAAVLSGGDRERAWALPDTGSRPNEIVVLASPPPNYIHQAAAMVGGKIVAVGTPARATVDDFDAAIGPKTAAVLYVYPWVEATLASAGNRAATLPAVAAVAHAKGVPVIVDAASEIPPREKLTRFHQEGGDLVVFSGGKGIFGPQSTGIVVGRADLTKAGLLNTAPHSSIGRGMKIGKEEVAGFVRAVEIFLERDESLVFANWERVANVVARRLAGIPGITVRVLAGEPRGRPPEEARCYVEIVDPALGTGLEIANRLQVGTPSLIVRVLDEGFFISPMTMQEGEETLVGELVAKALAR
jgi:uncharacterized pyridoxal phosphate-dependent enzyme